MSAEALRARLKAVREATGLKQQDFAAALDGAAQALLGNDAPRFTQTRVSDLERGGRYVALEDIAVYAAVDPKGRGKLWLAWGELADSAQRTARSPIRVVAEPEPIARPTKQPAAKNRKAK